MESMVKYMEDKEDVIHDMTCNGECSRCGNCCGLFIPFDDEDITRIKKYVQEHSIEQTNRINVLTGVFDAHCCFYDTVNKVCKIYPVRPYVCQDFICNRKNWLEKRNEYELKCKYNSTLLPKQIMATFDDMIYEDYEPILRYIFSIIIDRCGKVDHRILIEFLGYINRLDLLKHLQAVDEKGNKYEGIELEKLDR